MEIYIWFQSHPGIWSPAASPGSEPASEILEVIKKNLDVNSYLLSGDNYGKNNIVGQSSLKTMW